MNPMRTTGVCLALAALMILPAASQDQRHPPAASTQGVSPYAGMERRTVKALSDKQIVDLEAGRGMGLALAAELNGHPGPMHVLEHADALKLTADQKQRTRTLFEEVKAETIPLGQRLVAQETALDRAFAGRTITVSTLTEMTAAIGQTQSALRAAHLRYHLVQVELLTPEQLRGYAVLRGYAAGGHRDRGTH